MITEMLAKLSGKHYFECVIVSGGIVLKRIFTIDNGKKWVVFKGNVDYALILPSEESKNIIEEDAFKKETIEKINMFYFCGIREGIKTTLYYSVDSATPLVATDIESIENQDAAVLIRANSSKMLEKYVYRVTHNKDEILNASKTLNKGGKKIKPLKWQGSTVDTQTFKKLLSQKIIIDDLLSASVSKWEALQPVLIIAVIVIGGLLFFYMR